MIIQIGLMRAIGMSRKKIKSMFIQLSLIYMVLGTAIGILFGIILSYIGVKMVYGYSSMLTIGAPSIIYSFLVSVLSVSTSSFIVVRKAVKMSIIDSIKESEKYKKNQNIKVQKQTEHIKI
ncbi:ftsX-like permease family protein [[Clostridium] sordellii ATCC 9714]|nr:ftsX-like permease family protein [[Clostridium] sordellii ATCC 9714] [Paeniclostridium sordellii ATCC 9714]